MGAMYSWANPEYLLDHMTLEEVLFYYGQGLGFEEYRVALLIHKLDEALSDKPKKPKKEESQDDKPDKNAFYKRHGDKIKRPSKDGEINGDTRNAGS